MGRAGVADRAREIIDHRFVAHAKALCVAGHRTAMRAGDDQLVDVVGRERRGGQCPFPGLAHEWTVGDLTEALFPGTGSIAAGKTPALEELFCCDTGTEVFGHHRTIGVVPDEQRCGTVATGGFVGRGGQSTALISGDDERRHACGERRAQGSGAGTQCATEVEGTDLGTELQRSVDCGGVGLFEVGGRGRGEPECLRLEVGGGQGSTSGGDTHRGGVFVEGGHRALPATATLAEEGRDFGAVESVVRDVGPGGDDAPHDAPDAVSPSPAGSASRQQTTGGRHDLFALVSGRRTAKATRASARLTSWPSPVVTKPSNYSRP